MGGMARSVLGFQKALPMTDNALPESVRLRPMLQADLPSVHCLEVMSQPLPWPLWLFRRQLRSGASCWVLEAGGEIAGFGIVAIDKHRAHIMNMCVAPGYRRRGLGRRIMLHLLDVARHRHCRGAWLEVRRSNRPAVVLYRKLGFRTRRICKGYYPTRRGRLNGALMVRPLRTPRSEKH
jgi:ribosomal-protein-alanine N-acetyltransferase